MSSAEVAVTHQIKIGREDAWVRVGVVLDFDDFGHTKSIGAVVDQAEEIVNAKVIEVIEKTVATVNKYEESKK